MLDLSKLSADELAAIRAEVDERYLQHGGEDIDRAIARDRKVVAEHERELDHVATLPFDRPYRWRVAPSVGLRAQKDLERQQKRRKELLDACAEEVLAGHGLVAGSFAQAQGRPARLAQHKQAGAPVAVDQLNAFLGEAMEALNAWKQERAEASPPVESAVA